MQLGSAEAQMNITNSVMKGNRAYRHSGALYLGAVRERQGRWDPALLISNSTFDSNTAQANGGASCAAPALVST